MQQLEFAWTTEATEKMLCHFRKGERYADIAKALGTTYRAVNGKISRMDLLRDKSLLSERMQNGGSSNIMNGMHGYNPWDTPGVIDEFKILVFSGLSFRRIAARLGEQFGVRLSKSGCIAKADRLGWKRALPERERRARQARPNVHKKRSRGKKSFQLRELTREELEPVGPEQFLCVEFPDLKYGQCRYPHGEGPYSFCGQKTVSFSSYCGFHRDLTTVSTHGH